MASAEPDPAMPSVLRTIATDHPAFAGHFPGRPLLPGVSLLAEVLEAVLADHTSASDWRGPLRLAAAKFLAPVEPGARLRIDWTERDGRLRFEVWRTAAGASTAAALDAAAVLSASGTWEVAAPVAVGASAGATPATGACADAAGVPSAGAAPGPADDPSAGPAPGPADDPSTGPVAGSIADPVAGCAAGPATGPGR
jgi:3-hydroxymyristoyl/3-hydroxydecanoyl-(acyl carrier protein) dehydratase